MPFVFGEVLAKDVSPIPAAYKPTYTIISFDEILDGALGSREASAAAQWVEAGQHLSPLPTDLVTSIPSRKYLDTRVDYSPAPTQPTSQKKEKARGSPSPSSSKRSSKPPPKRRASSILGDRARSSLGEGTPATLSRKGSASAAPGSSLFSGAAVLTEAAGIARARLQEQDAEGSASFERDWTPDLEPAEATSREAEEVPDFSGATGWTFRLDSLGRPLFISPEGYSCSSWDEVKGAISAAQKLGKFRAPALLSWLREAATGGVSLYKLSQPTALGRMMALQRLRVATYEREREQRAFRAGALADTQ